MEAKLAATVAAQSGSDKKVQELLKALDQAARAKDVTEKTAEQRIAELEQKASEAEQTAKRSQLRNMARELLDEVNIKPPKYFDRLIGNDEEETALWVKAYIDEEQTRIIEGNKKFDRENGRTIDGPKNEEPSSYEKLLQMTPEEIRRLGPKAIAEIVNKAQTPQ